MAKKITVIRYTNPHYLAGCQVCDFTAARSTDETPEPKDVRDAVRKHVRQTGHTCWIEAASQTIYEIESLEIKHA